MLRWRPRGHGQAPAWADFHSNISEILPITRPESERRGLPAPGRSAVSRRPPASAPQRAAIGLRRPPFEQQARRPIAGCPLTIFAGAKKTLKQGMQGSVANFRLSIIRPSPHYSNWKLGNPLAGFREKSRRPPQYSSRRHNPHTAALQRETSPAWTAGRNHTCKPAPAAIISQHRAYRTMLSGKLATLAKSIDKQSCRNDSASFPACGKYTKRVLAPGSKCTGRDLRQTDSQAVTREIQGSRQHSEKYEGALQRFRQPSHSHSPCNYARPPSQLSACRFFCRTIIGEHRARFPFMISKPPANKATYIIIRYAHYFPWQLKLRIPSLCRPNIGRLRMHSDFFLQMERVWLFLLPAEFQHRTTDQPGRQIPIV